MHMVNHLSNSTKECCWAIPGWFQIYLGGRMIRIQRRPVYCGFACLASAKKNNFAASGMTTSRSMGGVCRSGNSSTVRKGFSWAHVRPGLSRIIVQAQHILASASGVMPENRRAFWARRCGGIREGEKVRFESGIGMVRKRRADRARKSKALQPEQERWTLYVGIETGNSRAGLRHQMRAFEAVFLTPLDCHTA